MGSIGLTFRRLRLLLWKNVLMRRRHYVITGFEILLPALLAIVLVYIRAKVDFSRNDPTYGPDENGNTGFPISTEEELRDRFIRRGWNCLLSDDGCDCNRSNFPEFRCTIPYAPNNSVTSEIMNTLLRTIMEDVESEGFEFQVKGFATEYELEVYKQSLDLPIPIPGPKDYFRGGIVFESENVLNRDSGKIGYKIRLDSDFNTHEIFPLFQLPGPDFGNAGRYRGTGFSGLQIILEKVLISYFTNHDMEELSRFNISTQAMPHPKYPAFDFNQLYQFVLPQFTVQGFIFIVPSIVRAVVAEKETGIKELMKMMGLPNWMHWVGWLINSLLALIISITLTVVLYFVEFSESGAVLVYSDPTLWWFILFLYCISGSAFCFFVSSFFQKATLATTVGVILWIVTYQPVQLYLDPRYPDLSLPVKMLTCLLPNMAIHFAYLIMCGFEAKGEGAKWRNIGHALNSNDTLTVLHVVAMFLVNTIAYIALAMYVENIMPTKYGVRKPWYYIFRFSAWYSKKSNPEEYFDDSVRTKQREDAGFESEPTDGDVGIDIRRLRKSFGKSKVAVDNVSLKMFHGQITALLGHNGAGKTTTISMITGLYSPSGGTAFVNGYDINKNMTKVRENLGLCPQHNMLFNKLTVAEHLTFFGRLKGLSVKDAAQQVEELLTQLQLKDKRNTMSVHLSGGQKRKVSLGCALVGGNKVVVLDEPTSGMDPEARRAIWDLLLELRNDRTILLTTHFMEEADVLGDRIAIMADGKLQCCGSPMFLKQFYGAGYTLKLTVTELANPATIMSTVQRHIPQAYFKSQDLTNMKDISIVLPTNTTPSSVFVPLFKDLSRSEIKSEVETMGLSLTTMDEVFVKVGELNHTRLEEFREESPFASSLASIDQISDSRDSKSHLHTKKLSGIRLLAQQFWGLLLKRILYTSRKYRHFISQLLIPVAVLIIAIVVSNRSFGTNKPKPALAMSFKDYKNPLTLFLPQDPSEAEIIRVFESVAIELGTSTKQVTGNLSMNLLDIGESDLGLYRESYMVAVEFNSSEEFTAMYSTIPYHASPLAINLMSNVILKQMLVENGQEHEDITLEVTNHPLRNTFYNTFAMIAPDPAFAASVAVLFSTILPIGLALLAATYIIFAVDERVCKAKQLQLMTGVNPMMYWVSSFAWDYFMMIIVICLMIACFPIFQQNEVYTSNNGTGVVFLFLAVYGFSAIWFSYLLSLWVNSVAGGFALVSIVHILAGLINLVVDALNNENTRSMQTFFRWFGRLFPAFGAGACSYHFSRISATNSACQLVPADIKALICVPNFFFGPFVQQCCDNCKELGAPCFQPDPFIKWRYELLDEPGIGQELLYMASIGIIYILILACAELGAFQVIKQKIFKTSKHSFTQVTNDADVAREAARVDYQISTGPPDDDALVVQNLSKSYGTFAAVSGITFGVRHGECFGLLGVNGAGKTTTFRMLTGDEVRSDGNVTAGPLSLQHNRKDFLATIGYCPQFDGIIDVLHGREMLELFCRLRGVPSRNVGAEADKWLMKLGLAESEKVECGNYSGGMKRRLSTAMALVADSPIILLDEPTSGVDPVARRQFWQVINSVRNAGQAVILTSHSMEECETLCNRLGIMVNGEMQCLGGVQHLKNKFAQGYSLTIKLKSIPNSSGLIQELSQEISQRFNPCTLKDQHQNILQYQVYNTTMAWDELFSNMEKVKSKYQQILEEYSVSGTTLEEVFLSFARKQYVGREAKISCFKKFITCQCCGQR